MILIRNIWLFLAFGALFVGVLAGGALLFGVHVGACDFLEAHKLWIVRACFLLANQKHRL